VTGRRVVERADSDGRLSTVSDWLSRSISLSYTVDGLQAGITRPDGVVTTNSYDSAGRLTGVSHTGPGSTALRHFTYTLDAAGNRTAVVSDAGTESYTLDLLNRITNVTYPQGDSASYTYDAVGNRLTKTTTQGGTVTYSYDDADELLSDGTQSYSYDANGNLLTAGSSVFSWDYANRLATAQTGGATASYSYDGDGNRTSKTVNGTTTPYLWDREAGLPLLASDGTNSYLGDPSGASDPSGGAGSLLGQLDASATPSYYLDDALGSVRGTAGTAGTLLASADYDVFGAARATSGQQPGAGIGYTSEQSDAETGFAYLHAREYNPLLGRFLSADSLQPNAPGTQGYDLYTYVANNPTTWVDPSGHAYDTAGVLRLAEVPFTGLMPYALGKCATYVPGCAAAIAYFMAQLRSGGLIRIGVAVGGLGVLAVICFLMDPCREATTDAIQLVGLGGSSGPLSPAPKKPTKPKPIQLPLPAPLNPGPKQRPDDCLVDPPAPDPYSDLTPFNPPGWGPYQDFKNYPPWDQRKRVIEANWERNGSRYNTDGAPYITSDDPNDPYHVLTLTPNLPNSAQLDHICPQSKGGTNSYDNAWLISMKDNGPSGKWDRWPYP
jgi:RHS repeat-associated protein